MKLRRAKIELDHDEISLLCSHHPDEYEPTIVEIGGKEYLGNLTIEKVKNTYIIKLQIKP
jgi:hypothetical protein